MIEKILRRRLIAAHKHTSQNEIAKAVGVDKALLSRFRHGQRGITAETADKLCEYFGLELTQKK